MAHNIDMTNGRANIAFMGDRKDIWHKLGTAMQSGMSVEDWAKAAGLEWTAEMRDAFMLVDNHYMPVEDVKHCVRSLPKLMMLGLARHYLGHCLPIKNN